MPRLLLVSCRLPVTVRVEAGSANVIRSPGGLATGLRGPHERSEGLWLGWPGDLSGLTGEQRETVHEDLRALRVVPLELSESEINGFYEGFQIASSGPFSITSSIRSRSIRAIGAHTRR